MTDWSGTYDSNKEGRKIKGWGPAGNTPGWTRVVIRKPGNQYTIQIYQGAQLVWGTFTLQHLDNDTKRAVNGNPPAGRPGEICNCRFYQESGQKWLMIVFANYLEKDDLDDSEGDEIGVWKAQYSGPPPDDEDDRS
jgi:hypothetical protein